MTREENLARIGIVLVQPEDCQNIGSVCRAAKTMGITSLSIVGREEFDEDRVRQLSVHAFDLFEGKRLFNTLEQALSRSSLSVAFTRRNGKFRKGVPVRLDALAQMIKGFAQGEILLVFGRESDGLTDEEVGRCNLVCSIETSPLFPSLNLAQAVQIAAYGIFTGLDEYSGEENMRKTAAARRDGVAQMALQACDSLRGIGYFKEASDEEKNFRTFLTDFTMRSGIAQGDVARIAKFFRKLHDIVKHKAAR